MVSAAMGLLMGVGSLAGAVLSGREKATGFDYYIESASTAAGRDKLELYRKSIALEPRREEGWLGIVEAVGADGIFTTEEDGCILSLLSSRDNGRSQDNKTVFRRNKAGYIRFAYNLGMLYYYAEGRGQNKASAGGWFDVVCKADLSNLDLGPDDDKKSAWKARAEILGKISGYSSRIGKTNQAGDAQTTYFDYWNDLMLLVDNDVAGRDNVVTELRLYNEIVYQICTRCDAFYEAGVAGEDMARALNDVENRIRGLYITENPVAEELKQEILKAALIGRKQVEAVLANARTGIAGDAAEKGGGVR
ncbi:MAG TPA: hypothetical protein DF613_02760 [Lachnospiraceae bacterium]|nr:hypothetical protein [Lachnospiraceae bacterium]